MYSPPFSFWQKYIETLPNHPKRRKKGMKVAYVRDHSMWVGVVEEFSRSGGIGVAFLSGQFEWIRPFQCRVLNDEQYKTLSGIMK